jgi:hypothetical protein
MSYKILEDKEGNKSSKRVAGSVLLLTGIIFSLVLFFISLTEGAGDPTTAISIINAFLFSGSGLLGSTAFERLQIRK